MKKLLVLCAVAIFGLSACGPLPWDDCVMATSCGGGEHPNGCNCQMRWGDSFECEYENAGDDQCCYTDETPSCGS
jgi:hypothetical protein